MLRLIPFILVAAIAAIWAADAVAATAPLPMGTDAPHTATSVAHVTCYEDEPCWHWPTMGNLKRGITTKRGTFVVVGACRFARMSARRRIDWTRTEHIRGDRWARRYGCVS